MAIASSLRALGDPWRLEPRMNANERESGPEFKGRLGFFWFPFTFIGVHSRLHQGQKCSPAPCSYNGSALSLVQSTMPIYRSILVSPKQIADKDLLRPGEWGVLTRCVDFSSSKSSRKGMALPSTPDPPSLSSVSSSSLLVRHSGING